MQTCSSIFKLIQGVGAFSIFGPENRFDLSEKYNIYANNGYGKSTIATILKSAYINDPQRIIAQSFNRKKQQYSTRNHNFG